MTLKEVLRLAIEAMLAHKFRSALTIIGMVIGVFAVVVLVSIGQGAKNYVLSEFQSLGTNFIVIQPGKTDKKGAFGPPVGAAQRKMTLDDVVALEKRALNLEAVSGVVLATASIRLGEAIHNSNVFGVNEQFQEIVTLPVAVGEYFGREEAQTGRRVAVIGSNVKQNLFGNEVAIGRAIKLNSSEFRVVGVLAKSGQKLGFDFDEIALIPTRAALRLFNEDKLFGIRAKASSRVSLDDAVAEITDILKDRRNGEEDFTIITQVAMMQSMDKLLDMLTYVLGAIAAVSMVVGGIGIMNIMLVSVSERTSEIGIRRAVGARRIDIMKQFLTEACVLSAVSGLAGVGGALLLTYGAAWAVPSFDMRAPNWILIPAFLMALIVGTVFGVWPARKAAKIETLDALRYE